MGVINYVGELSSLYTYIVKSSSRLWTGLDSFYRPKNKRRRKNDG